MLISGCHDLPLATFNSPVVNTRPTPEQPPRKKQHRHSGIFRVADLGPGTMPRGKYPESPAPAGSHALISRTPTPGGMLHANLGLPRPPPRNFQPPLPRFPSRLSPRRMSGTTVGRILSHALPWSRPPSCKPPQNKRQQHSSPIVIPEFSFRDSGMKISGISAARRRIPSELRLRCREATAREGHCPSQHSKKPSALILVASLQSM